MVTHLSMLFPLEFYLFAVKSQPDRKAHFKHSTKQARDFWCLNKFMKSFQQTHRNQGGILLLHLIDDFIFKNFDYLFFHFFSWVH